MSRTAEKARKAFAEMRVALAAARARIRELEAANARLREQHQQGDDAQADAPTAQPFGREQRP